jgi:hypothetical protein
MRQGLTRSQVSVYHKVVYASMVELVDTLDLGSSAARRGGSSPLTRTITQCRSVW